MRSRKLKYGSLSVALTLAVLGAFVLVNLLGDLLTNRYYLKLDMTREKFYEISDETRQALSALREDITVTVLANEYELDQVRSGANGETLDLPKVRETLSKYALMSGGRLTVRYLDPDVNAALVQKYTEDKALGRFGIVVESARRFKTVPISDLFATQDQMDPYGLGMAVGKQTVGLQAEQALTSAIMSVTLDKLPKAVFTAGHGEAGADALQTLLTKANYSCEAVNLTTDDLPGDAVLLVVNSPTVDFTADETYKLDAFFANNGHAMVLFGQAPPALPVLERYLSEWGVGIERKLIIDSERYVGQQHFVIPQVMKHDATLALEGASFPPVMMGGPVASLWTSGEQGSRKTTSLLQSAKTSYARPVTKDTQITDLGKQPGDTDGPFSMGVLSEQLTYEGTTPRKAGIFVSSDFLTANDVLNMPNLLNSRFVMSLVSYMCPVAQSVVIQPKQYDIEGAFLNEGVTKVQPLLFIVLLVLIPLGLLAGGVLTWRRRKNL